MKKQSAILMCLLLATSTVLSACGSKGSQGASVDDTITMAISQVGDIPSAGNPIQTQIEKYTGKKLDVQWIPNSAYDDKINVMIASGDMPDILKVNYTPAVTNAMRNDVFWEVGPYLKDYPNLAAQADVFYDNVKVDGKIYGVPRFSDIARATLLYRSDWFKKLKLDVPKSTEDWYNDVKALTLNDPDGNGKKDTYGMMLFKKYNEGEYSFTTRLAVSLGAPNKWKVEDDGSFTPEFMTAEYKGVMDLLKRLYDEQLINQDFAVFDSTEADKKFDSGLTGMKIAVAQTAKSQLERLQENVPDAEVDLAKLEGPDGYRVPAQSGNAGILVFPKVSVPTEEDLKALLSFLDKLMDPEMSTLLLRGVDGKHYKKLEDGRVEMTDFAAFQREVKPYRDNLPLVEGYNVPAQKDTKIGEKGVAMAKEITQYAIPNPALTLYSPTYEERGGDLDQMINDAQTKYIMGKIDENGWQQQVELWKTSGGDKVMQEYASSYKEQQQQKQSK